MFKSSIKLKKDLMERIAQVSEAAGYSSPQEFVEHVLERELARIGEEAESKEEIVKKLKGLGYLE
jgi:mannitol/fructose-specific phosphotransferase system IIA component (Ntr-type)